MPKPVFFDHSDLEGSIFERVLGASGKQRSTKTWIPTTALVQRLGVLRAHSQRLLNMFRNLESAVSPGSAPTDKFLREKYPCIASYENLHQEISEHLSSYRGFALRAVLGESPDMNDKPKSESTAGAGAPPSTPPPAAPPQPAPAPTMAMK